MDSSVAATWDSCRAKERLWKWDEVEAEIQKVEQLFGKAAAEMMRKIGEQMSGLLVGQGIHSLRSIVTAIKLNAQLLQRHPPYSIKQWDRDTFTSDPWGRNLYGTPPQGRADYAFWQHILCSLTPKIAAFAHHNETDDAESSDEFLSTLRRMDFVVLASSKFGAGGEPEGDVSRLVGARNYSAPLKELFDDEVVAFRGERRGTSFGPYVAPCISDPCSGSAQIGH